MKNVSSLGWPSLHNSKVYDLLFPEREVFHYVSQHIYKVLTEQHWCDISTFNVTEYSMTDCEKDEKGDKAEASN